MKTLQQLEENIKKTFQKSTGIDIEKGTVIDSYIVATANALEQAYKEIEDNKTPFLFSKLKGKEIDEMAILCGLTRQPNESDTSFLYRLMNWNTSNKAANLTSIETALMNMEYCSHVTFVPQQHGCGTGAAYIIPKNISEAGKELAIKETKLALAKVVSPSSYIEYITPDIIKIKMRIIIKSQATDLKAIKDNISKKITEYVNGIAPGKSLEVGKINKIGTSEKNIEYFNVANLFLNKTEIRDVSVVQKIDSKFLLNKATDIEWLEVE